MRRISSLLALAFPLAPVATESAARCAAGPFNIQVIPGVETNGVMEARSGEPCGIFVNASRGVLATRVTQAPRRGIVRRFGVNLFYRSAPGFVGTDSFVYQRDAEDRGGVTRQATVRVNVNVR